MTNESDSSTLLSEQEKKCRKLHKKSKKKSNKKHKKEKTSYKKKKQSYKDTTNNSSEEDDIKTLPQTKYEENANMYEGTNAFGPALPPSLLNKNKKVENEPLVIGPKNHIETLGSLDNTEQQNLEEKRLTKEVSNISKTDSEYDNMQSGFYGPLPVTNEFEMTPAQLELEQRALELKMAAIDGVSASTSNQNVREEWMLELPNIGLKGGLAALNNLKRTFHQGKEKPDFSDRSSWTKTPNSNQEKKKSTGSKRELKLQAEALLEKQRDAEQEAMARQHKKKHKREESLVEIHQKKLRKEEKKKLKELKKNGTKSERRPFTRDIDLKLNKIDRNQTKQIVDKAKILNTKFSSGHAKFL